MSSLTASPVIDRVLRHDLYYIQGGDVIFRVENYLFRVHRYFFVRESPYFREKLPHPAPPGDFSKGKEDSNPFVLDDALSTDFARFLWVFYNPKYSIYNANVEEWTSILKLAHQWQFAEIKSLAVRSLEELEINAVQKIVIYHSYEIDRNLLLPSYTALTTREEPISIAEGKELGLETSLQLARAREVARGKNAGGQRSPSAVNVPAGDLDSLIKDLFQLPPPQPLGTLLKGPAPPSGATPNGTALNGAQVNGNAAAGPKGAAVNQANSFRPPSVNGAPNGAAPVGAPANGSPYVNGNGNPAVNGAANANGNANGVGRGQGPRK